METVGISCLWHTRRKPQRLRASHYWQALRHALGQTFLTTCPCLQLAVGEWKESEVGAPVLVLHKLAVGPWPSKSLSCLNLCLHPLKNNTTKSPELPWWLRIHLAMQGTQVQFLVWEDTTYCEATKPKGRNYWSLCTEPVHWKRSHWNEKFAHCNEEQSLLVQLEIALM